MKPRTLWACQRVIFLISSSVCTFRPAQQAKDQFALGLSFVAPVAPGSLLPISTQYGIRPGESVPNAIERDRPVLKPRDRSNPWKHVPDSHQAAQRELADD